MHRRDFLRLLLSSPAAQYVDYEKLLWIPGEKKIFLPSDPLGTFFDLDALNGILYHDYSYNYCGDWMGLARVGLTPDDLAKVTWEGFKK